MGYSDNGLKSAEKTSNSDSVTGTTPVVPTGELVIVFVRSSGPGGQNVNKTATKAQLRWNVGRSRAFSAEQKAAIRAAAGHRLNVADEIVLSAEAERSQAQNLEAVIGRLRALVSRALVSRKKRRPTKVSRAQKLFRLEAKRRTAEKKKFRKPPKGEW